MRTSAYWIVRCLPIVDALTLAFFISTFTRWSVVGAQTPVMIVMLLAVAIAHYSIARAGVYDSHRVEGIPAVLRKLLLGYVITLLAVFAAMMLVGRPETAFDLCRAFAASFIVLAIGKAAVYLILQLLRRRGFDVRAAIFVGSQSEAEEFAVRLREHPQWGLRLDCVADADATARQFVSFPDGERLGSDLESVLTQRVIDEVLVPVHTIALSLAIEDARMFQRYGLMVRFLFEPMNGPYAQPTLHEFAGGTALAVTSVPRKEKDLAMKRVFDMFVALALLIVSTPLLAFIVVLIKMTSRGPVFFSQTRVGLNGRRFRMFKFRTMIDGAELLVRNADRSITRGPIFKDPQDYRVTPIGRILRRFSLDELPQLWNVIRGEMSIVGPRPLPVYEAAQILGEYRRRFAVPPGLTCIWQVSGRSDVAYESWMQYDLQYVEAWSLWFDMKLFLRTIPVVLSGRGGY